MTFLEYVSMNIGRSIDIDGFPPQQPFQCTDWLQKVASTYYALDTSPFLALDGGYANGGAADAIENWGAVGNFISPNDATMVLNNPNDLNQYPLVGSIIVFGRTQGNGWAGHIAAVTQVFPGENRFISADQNAPLPSVQYVTHTYDNSDGQGFGEVLGWIIPHELGYATPAAPTPPPVETPQIESKTNINMNVLQAVTDVINSPMIGGKPNKLDEHTRAATPYELAGNGSEPAYVVRLLNTAVNERDDLRSYLKQANDRIDELQNQARDSNAAQADKITQAQNEAVAKYIALSSRVVTQDVSVAPLATQVTSSASSVQVSDIVPPHPADPRFKTLSQLLADDINQYKNSKTFGERSEAVQQFLNALKDYTLPTVTFVGTLIGFTATQINFYGANIDGTFGYVIAGISIATNAYITFYKTQKNNI